MKSCKFFLKGNCTKGDECQFSHDLSINPTEKEEKKDKKGRINKTDIKPIDNIIPVSITIPQPIDVETPLSKPKLVIVRTKKATSQITELISNDPPNSTNTFMQSTDPIQSSKIRVVRVPFAKPVRQDLTASLIAAKDPISRSMLLKNNEIETLKLRYPAMHQTSSNDSQTLTLELIPSDPDFPFDLPFLKLCIVVPGLYPDEISNLDVIESSIPQGLIDNLKREWKYKSLRDKCTLIEMVKWLDRNLEVLLVEKESSLKFVNNDDAFVESVGSIETLDIKDAMGELNGEDTDIQATIATNTSTSDQSHHKGHQIRFPLLQFTNIAILECISLALLIRCSKCKNEFEQTIVSITQLYHQCPQCTTLYPLKFRPTFMTLADKSIGYLDQSGIVLIEVMASNYLATCECGERQIVQHAQSSFFKQILLSSTEKRSCHVCHALMILKLDSAKFVKLAPAVLEKFTGLLEKRKSKVESVEWKCKHMKKSMRLFRFGCCGRVYPCDRCHEELKGDDHEMVWATRMICGGCRRETGYLKDFVCSCGNVMGKKGGQGGYWEGGKGTRNRTEMSKNDEKKYRGLSKTVSNKARK